MDKDLDRLIEEEKLAYPNNWHRQSLGEIEVIEADKPTQKQLDYLKSSKVTFLPAEIWLNPKCIQVNEYFEHGNGD